MTVDGSGWLAYSREGHAIRIASITGTRIVGAILTPAEAQNIDQKADDGFGGGGKIKSTWGVGQSTTSCVYASWQASPGKYNLNVKTPTCVLFFWID